MKSQITSRVVYSTYFDSGYLPRALTLIESIRAQGDQSEVWALCLDEASYGYLNSAYMPGVHAFSLHQLEEFEPKILEVKSQRSRVEYIFTVGPTFHQFVMKNHVGEGDVLVYLDADLFFFENPGLVLEAMNGSSVGIIEHRYKKLLKAKLEKYGLFNVGWAGFRNDEAGRKVLNWWAERCIDWCFDTPQKDGRYADQGYLNWFPDFEGVTVLKQAGFNLAPWNTGSHEISYDFGKAKADGQPLVFFHFHGIREIKNWYITSQLVYKNFATKALIKNVYTPYLGQLHKFEAVVQKSLGAEKKAPAKRGKGLRGVAFEVLKKALNLVSILTGNAVSKKSFTLN